MTPDDSASRSLLASIAEEIRRDGPITFARFMDLALNDPAGGYYARGGARLGPDGDFFTASDAGDAFGECLARQLAEMDERLGAPDPFRVVELGGGRGLLARDVLHHAARNHPDLASRLRYTLVDTSAAMREEASRRAPRAETAHPSALVAGGEGCVLAVELFDAIPVHRLRRRGGRLCEVRVAVNADGALVEHEGEADARAMAMAERYGAAPAEGDEGEVSPASLEVLDRMAGIVGRGFFAIVDYGHPAEDLYAPRRRRGTVLAYRRHAVSEDLLEFVGEQDLTAHVNFTALEDRAREIGLEVLGRTTQDRFLVANGILERFEVREGERWGDPAQAKRRLQAMQLIHPDGMGRTFRVLVLAKGIAPGPSLRGLVDPFRR